MATGTHRSAAPWPPDPPRRPRRAVERHPGDVVRVLLGAAVVAGSAVVARHARVPRLEIDLFRVVNDLPAWITPLLWVPMQAGTLGAVAVFAVVALLCRRPGLARDLVASGLLAYAAALVVKHLVGRGRPDVLVYPVLVRGHDTGLGFVSGHAAVAAALAAAAGPWLPRPWRRAAWGLATVVALARVFMGAHLILDVIGGAALGWAVAAAWHLLWGAPVLRTETPGLLAALSAAGLRPISGYPARADSRGSRPFVVTTADQGTIFVKVIGYHERNADLLYKLFRHLVFREVEDESPFATTKQQAEHEAFLALLAQRAGVRTPPVTGVGPVAGGDIWLAETYVPAEDLEHSAPDPISDDTLRDAWRQVSLLHAAHIAHRDLRSANILVDADGRAWLIDFGFAESSASDRRLAGDVAELLVSMSLRVGPDRAVSAAEQELGRPALVAAAPLLQPLALTARTRHALHRRTGLLAELCTAVGAATGEQPREPAVLVRVRMRTLGWIAATVFATYVLLPQVGQLGATIAVLGDAQWPWLAGALVMSGATYAAAALVLMGASPRPLPFGRTVNVQLATSFANRVAPYGLGATAVNVRYLERSGLPRATALAAIAVTLGVAIALHLLELIAAGIWLGRTRQLLNSQLPSAWGLLIGFIAIMTIVGLSVAALVLRPDWLAEFRQAATSMGSIVRRPWKAVLLIGGQLATNAAYVAALWCAVYAFGAHPSAALVTTVFLAGSALGAASPTPAGLGVVEASLVAGLTVGGVEAAPAIAGVLAYRLATFWIPATGGFFSFAYLQRRRFL